MVFNTSSQTILRCDQIPDSSRAFELGFVHTLRKLIQLTFYSWDVNFLATSAFKPSVGSFCEILRRADDAIKRDAQFVENLLSLVLVSNVCKQQSPKKSLFIRLDTRYSGKRTTLQYWMYVGLDVSKLWQLRRWQRVFRPATDSVPMLFGVYYHDVVVILTAGHVVNWFRRLVVELYVVGCLLVDEHVLRQVSCGSL